MTSQGLFWAVTAGLVAGVVIGKICEYYTSGDYKPVQGIAEQCETGAATNVIAGLAVGMKSTGLPVRLSEMRPSCGARVSAIFIFAMTLRRTAMAGQ